MTVTQGSSVRAGLANLATLGLLILSRWDNGKLAALAAKHLSESLKLKPSRHTLDVSPVVFFVARLQATFFAWNHEEIQDAGCRSLNVKIFCVREG